MSTTTQTSPPRPATWMLKVAMAITGSILVAFVLVHLFGNLKVYTGAEHFDDFGKRERDRRGARGVMSLSGAERAMA